MMYEVETSVVDTVEVSEARNSSTKNSTAHTCPRGRCVKMDGNTSNTSLGPATGSMPNENTAGKMMTPASTATSVSDSAVTDATRASGVRSLK